MLAVSFNVQAKDFGVIGHTYEIAEQDILEYIAAKLKKLDLGKIEKQAKQRVTESVNKPKPVPNIINTKEERSYLYDPTFVLDEDIVGARGEIIYLRGVTVNPLERIPLREELIFINGDIEEQIQFALEEHKKRDKKAKIILTNGSPIKLQKQHKIWIYFDQFGFLTSKLSIKQVPAIVSQEGLRLKISEVTLKQ